MTRYYKRFSIVFCGFFSYTTQLFLMKNIMTTHALIPLPNQVLAYTDGACRGNGVADNAKGGYGAVIILPTGEQIEICGGEPTTTNNRMELMGAIAAVENSPAHLPIQLWTDSGYVKNGITQWIHGWKKNGWRKADKKPVLNVELWQRLDAACQQRVIDWQWVKGHAGHEGNEYADKLANQGLDNLPKTFDKKVIDVSTADVADNDMDNLTDKKKEHQMTKDKIAENPANLHQTIDANLEQPIDQNSQTSFDQQVAQSAYADDYAGEGGYDDRYDDVFMKALDDPQASDWQSNPPDTLSPQPVNQSQVDFSGFMDNRGYFIAQDETLQSQRPNFDGVTSQPNTNFVPLLPLAKNHKVGNRQLILDTETTGFEPQNGDRIIEVGIVELVNRRFTGEKLHVYLNPHKQMDNEVIKIHGIHNVFLDSMPTFEQVGKVLHDFLQGAELIAHNASFDMNFLQAEFNRAGLPDITQYVTVTDSLAIAKQLYAGQRNTLDALVKRLNVGKQDRTFHGALLDAEILAEVYLAMTGGQVSLAIDDMAGGGISGAGEHIRFDMPVARFIADSDSQNSHQAWLSELANKYPQLASNWGMAIETQSDH